MNSITETSFIIKQLTEINEKYKSMSFVDIDFIVLFGLTKHSKSVANLEKIKKKITTKYYSLALKYHPDKHIDSVDLTLEVKNCLVLMDEIKNGSFISFINDIHQMLIMMIDEDPTTLINIMNGNTENLFSNFDTNVDYDGLKRKYNNTINKEYFIPSSEELHFFTTELKKMSVSEFKINEDDTKTLIKLEKEKRDKLIIDKIFTEKEQTEPDFSDKFNSVFDKEKNKNSELELIKENLNSNSNFNLNSNQDFIQPFNYNSSLFNPSIGLGVSTSSINTSISDVSEAYGPLNIGKIEERNTLSFDELMAKRRMDDDLFKIPGQSN